jgi:hypothetical protein
LARAKKQLRHGLTRRDWALSTAAVVATLGDKTLAATLPAGLVHSTVACVANAGDLSARVLALSQGALHMLWLNKLKMAAGVVVAIVLVGTGTGLVVRETWARGREGRLGVNQLVGSPAKGSAARAKPQDIIVGSGKAITKDIELRDFTSVDVGDGFEVQIGRGATFKTTITIDDNLFQYGFA